jgi:hypothetical protein
MVLQFVKLLKGLLNPELTILLPNIGNFNGTEIAVILSGFVGRLDNYAKLRLGKEIESYIGKYEIGHGV